MRVSKDLILREIAGEYILVPVGKAAQKIHGMINLSETAAFLWNILQNQHSENELIEALLEEYDVDRNIATCDVRDFIVQMEQLGIVEMN